MEIVNIGKFIVVGIFVYTTNEGGQSQNDIGQLWQQFYGENVMEQIPNKIDKRIYAVYSDYSGDETAPYEVIIGCAVSSSEQIPEGMKSVTVEGGRYQSMNSTTTNAQQFVMEAWQKIWTTQMDRTFQADFEVYELTETPGTLDISVNVGVK